MKKQVIISEKLPHPFPHEVNPFEIGDNVPVPVFGDTSIEALKAFATIAHELMQNEPLVVFWGLSGKLGNFYSTVKDKMLSQEMLNAKITMVNKDQPFSIYREKGFELMVERIGGMSVLRSIPFEEAMLIAEGKKEPPTPDYEEPEEAEFDENCTPECRPSDHKCGK